MSHCGYREVEASSKLKHLSTYTTKGNYRGFVNSFLYPSANESIEVDPNNFNPDPLNKLNESKGNVDLNAVYLRLQSNPLPRSNVKPEWLEDSDKIDFYSISDYIHKPEELVGEKLGFSQKSLERILNMDEGETISSTKLGEKNPRALFFTNVDLHDYTLSFGRDSKGIYSSVYDVWDFEPNGGYFEKNKIESPIELGGKILPLIGKPIHFYDRIYWSDVEANETSL